MGSRRRRWLNLPAAMVTCVAVAAVVGASATAGSTAQTAATKPIYILYYTDKIPVWRNYLLPAAKKELTAVFPNTPIIMQSANSDEAKQLGQAEAVAAKGASGVFLGAAEPAQS